MLQVKEADVFYGPVQALRGVSLEVGEGEKVALLGSNGAGKTTTLRAISGMLSPARGEILLEGKEIGRLPAQKVVRLGVAHMPEGRELFPDLTVHENLVLGHWSRRRQKKLLSERLERVFDMFPRLRERSSQQASTLSGGEQQMLTFGRALMCEPRLLLVDELSLGLAPKIVAQLFNAIDEVNRQGTAVLVVEQFVHMALRNTDRAYVLAKGEVALEGKSAELLASPDLLSAYLGDSSAEAADDSKPSSNGVPKGRRPKTPKKTKGENS